MHNQFIAGPERPIRFKAEDVLDRSRFVQRLCDAIINRETGRSTGVTIGLTGEWGSGKSSILNLLDEHTRQRYPSAVVVRFDPWLVSGRDDLVRQFFLEFEASLKEKPSLRDRFAGIADRLAQYSSHLAPMINVTLPGGGDVVAGGLAIAQKALSRETTLHQQRYDLMRSLQEITAPLIVIIDELDRIEDAEIRAVAQLVRAIADFPSISYVLAYDVNRVMQALGTGGDNNERTERGRAYLEKIVQFQIALPATLETELAALLNAELTKLIDEIGLPENWQDVKRFRDLINLIIPRYVATSRDVKRLVGTYHVLGSMVKGEVDWSDLLAFSLLMIKAPATVTKLRQQPDLVVENPAISRLFMERHAQRESKPDERLAMFVSDEERNTGAVQLLPFLFPWFASGKGTESRNRESLCYRRPLLTVLRLGLLPDAFSAADVRAFLTSNTDQIEQSLWRLYEDERLRSFLERLEEVYSRAGSENPASIWLGISRFLRKDDGIWPRTYSSMRELPPRFATLFSEVFGAHIELRGGVATVICALLDDGDVELSSNIVIEQVLHHGLFDTSKSDRYIELLSAKDTETLALRMTRDFHDRHLSSGWISTLRDPRPLFMLLEMGGWDQACKDRLTTLLEEDSAFDAFILLLFGGNYITFRESIANLIDLEKYLERLEARLSSPSLAGVHPTVRAALEKAGNRS